MTNTHEGYLPIPSLPKTARKAYIFPALADTSLISIGQLCDAGCEAHFTKTDVSIEHQGKLILHGVRNQRTQGLWHLQLPGVQKAMATIPSRTKPEDLVNFAHAALYFPVQSTMLRAIQKGFLPPFPGLNETTFRKYTPRSEATIKGHLDAKRKNQQSTKVEEPDIYQQLLDDAFPPQQHQGTRSHQVFLSVHRPRPGRVP